MSLCGKIGGRKKFDLNSRKPLNEDLEDDDESTKKDSSTTIEKDSDNSSSDDEDINVSFLLVDKDFEEIDMVAIKLKVIMRDHMK